MPLARQTERFWFRGIVARQPVDLTTSEEADVVPLEMGFWSESCIFQ